MLVMSMGHLLSALLLGRDRTAVDVQLDGRKCLEKRLHNLGIDRVSWNMLANGHTVFLAQKVAEITGSAFVLHN